MGGTRRIPKIPERGETRKMTDYKVGYKKPPHHSRFKPGNRVNPNGRRGKRERPTEAEIVHEIMTQSVTFVEGGKSKRAPRIKLMIKSVGAAALKGDIAAADQQKVFVVIGEIDGFGVKQAVGQRGGDQAIFLLDAHRAAFKERSLVAFRIGDQPNVIAANTKQRPQHL